MSAGFTIPRPAATPHGERPAEALRNSRVSPYLVVDDVADRLRCSKRTVHELTRSDGIPHRVLPGTRRCLFRVDELEAWEAGAPLERIDLEREGRVVRPAGGVR